MENANITKESSIQEFVGSIAGDQLNTCQLGTNEQYHEIMDIPVVYSEQLAAEYKAKMQELVSLLEKHPEAVKKILAEGMQVNFGATLESIRTGDDAMTAYTKNNPLIRHICEIEGAEKILSDMARLASRLELKQSA